MKFMLLIHGDDATYAALAKDTFDRMMAAHEALQRELTASGELLDTNELSSTDARVLRTKDGAPMVTDGPYAESKDVVAGYYLVECVDIDRASEIAGRLLEAEVAPIEIRPIT